MKEEEARPVLQEKVQGRALLFLRKIGYELIYLVVTPYFLNFAN